MLALSNGVSTYKMHNGHRGANHPVQNLKTGKSEVTSQNHGFGINTEDVNADNNIVITHINLNDNTIEGIELKDKPLYFLFNIIQNHHLDHMIQDIYLMNLLNV